MFTCLIVHCLLPAQECKLLRAGTLSTLVTALLQYFDKHVVGPRYIWFPCKWMNKPVSSQPDKIAFLYTNLCPPYTSNLGDRGHFLFIWIAHAIHSALDLCLWTWSQKACLSSWEVRLTRWVFSHDYLNSPVDFVLSGYPFKRKVANLWRNLPLECYLKNGLCKGSC